ncbi:unnamed protein product [Strongylus vulgaris]|uniref:Uncharacterized protein n=1 Tax=Strongylus vulgaris TaxID=40348 RepID=A0A3P7J2H7_STRVU|nr:unnamed protein product [Strongylus vulgaris]
MSLDDFWDPPVFNRFRQSLAALDTWEEQNVFVVGAQHAVEGVEVNLVVMDRGRLVKSWKVEDLLRSEVKKIERLSLMKVEVVRDESCAKEPCPYYQKCRQTLKHVDAVDVYQTDNFIARTVKTLKTFVCECPPGFSKFKPIPTSRPLAYTSTQLCPPNFLASSSSRQAAGLRVNSSNGGVQLMSHAIQVR